MKKRKPLIVLSGNLLAPLKIGQTAILDTAGKILHTSRVVSIQEQASDRIQFETATAHYQLNLSPFPLAAVSPRPEALAACA